MSLPVVALVRRRAELWALYGEEAFARVLAETPMSAESFT
jgi:hypothetical protein